jgi:hypothetical protein
MAMKAVRPIEMLQRFVLKRAQAREHGATVRGLLDFAILITGLGAAGMVGASIALGSATLGLELGSRLAFALCLLLAVRPWTAAR